MKRMMILGVPEDSKVVEAKALEVLGVQAAEAGDLDTALDYFSKAVEVAPHWPSAHNNRAQALRLKGDNKGVNQNQNWSLSVLNLASNLSDVQCNLHNSRE